MKNLEKKNSKKDDHQYNLIKKMKKEINEEFKTLKENEKLREEKRQKEKLLKKAGLVTKAEKLHKY